MSRPSSRRAAPDIAALEAEIGHAFAQRALLMTALTHVSALSGEEGRTASYQRLEFLGDRVLGLAVADMLVRHLPASDEGDLSRRLADLVRKETCAEVAEAWGASAHVRLGTGFVTQGRRNRAILGDVCEAIIGAVFLDAGFETARAVVERAFSPRMLTPARPLRDAKTQLQEWAQARGLPLPVYHTVSRAGPDHAPVFRIEAIVEGLPSAIGDGPSKRAAEQAAASAFLAREGVSVQQAQQAQQ